jgi:E3 ubiquitin-protein ligase HUWE1
MVSLLGCALLLTSFQVIQAIPNALGALCLNEVGQAQLLKRPSIIPAIFSIFTSEQHLKILLDKENTVLIGTAIDELIRHHPTLKTVVFESLRSTLSKIEILGNAYTVPENLKKWYKLTASPPPSTEVASDEEAPMEGVVAPSIVPPPIAEPSTSRDVDMDDEEDLSTKSHDNTIVSFIDIMGRVGPISRFFFRANSLWCSVP